MQTSAIRVDISDGGLATMTLTQAARNNPFDAAMVRELKDVALKLWDTPGLRCVLLRAEGKNFSFGGDLKSFFPERNNLGPLVRNWTADLNMALQRIWRLPVPVVAEVQGWAMGGAVALLAGSDVVVAGQSARFNAAFTQIGFSCDSGTSVTLTARMGAARAKRFVMLAQELDSQEALTAGLVDQVAEDTQLTQEALAVAQRLAQGPTVAYGEVKRLFHRASAIQMESLLEDEALTLARVALTEDAREGMASQMTKRAPAFIGR